MAPFLTRFHASFCGGATLAVTAALASATSGQEPAFEVAPVGFLPDFYHQVGLGTYGIGGGAAWFDYDLDLDEDLFVLSSGGGHALFRHDGDHMTDVAAAAGLHETKGPPAFIGVSTADHDQDGLPDLFLAAVGPNSLCRNLGDGTFRDRAAAAGVEGGSFSASAAWADFDLDGDLDLYVGNYIEQEIFPYHIGQANELFLSNGAPAPRYEDHAPALGVDNTGPFGPSVPGFPFVSPEGERTAGCTLSVCTLDIDEDGDPDLMVGNDFGEWVLSDRLYRNELVPGERLAFTDISEQTGFGNYGHYDMGINAADYDHDGDWDFYLTNIGDNRFFRNDGGRFVDAVHEIGPVEGQNDAGTLLLSSWGTVWADFDHDLWEDLFVVNGFMPAAWFIENDSSAPNHLWMNAHDGTLQRLDPELSGLANTGAARGVAAADVDRDGWLDVYVVNNGAFDAIGVGPESAASHLFFNRLGALHPERHWLELWLRGWHGNLEGIGARVRVEVGGEVLRRQVLADPVYVSSGSRIVHFGLAQHALVPRIVVDWPSGIHQELVDVRGDRLIQLLEPKVTIEETPAPWVEGELLHLPLVLANHRDESVEVSGGAVVRVASTGEVLAKSPAWTTLGPGEVAAKELALELPGDWPSGALELVARVECEGALDMRLVPFVLD